MPNGHDDQICAADTVTVTEAPPIVDKLKRIVENRTNPRFGKEGEQSPDVASRGGRRGVQRGQGGGVLAAQALVQQPLLVADLAALRS